MDLFSRTCLDLGSSFILIKRIDWIISSTGWLLRIIFAAVFLLLIISEVCQRFQRKWKFIAMIDVWDFYSGFSFAIAQTEIDSSVTSILNSLTPLNTLVLGISFGVGFERRQVWGVLIDFWEAYF
jgi:drug/metabolite transporter (DMT)-like permease